MESQNITSMKELTLQTTKCDRGPPEEKAVRHKHVWRETLGGMFTRCLSQ